MRSRSIGTAGIGRWRRAPGGRRLVDVAVGAASELGFELRDAATGGASDANTTSAAGTPTIDGLGPIGGDDHAPGGVARPHERRPADRAARRDDLPDVTGELRPLAELHPDAYRALVEGVPAILYIDRPDELSTNLYTSPQVERVLGFTRRGVGRRRRSLWVRRLHPDDRDRVDEQRESNLRGEPSSSRSTGSAPKDGRDGVDPGRGAAVTRPTTAPSCSGAASCSTSPREGGRGEAPREPRGAPRTMQQRRQLAQLWRRAQEEERRRIAADIHDDPIQVMSAVDMRLQILLERPTG